MCPERNIGSDSGCHQGTENEGDPSLKVNKTKAPVRQVPVSDSVEDVTCSSKEGGDDHGGARRSYGQF